MLISKRFFLTTACCLLATALLVGCAMTTKQENLKEPPAPLQTQAVLKYSDLPVPLGFKLLPEDSYSFDNSGIRVAVLKYKGKGTTTQVVSFYKEQLPMFGWTILNTIEYGSSMLNLDNGSETCVINVIPGGSSSTISISLGPKSQSSPKKTKQIIK